jgi:hypothetical protein
MRLVWLEVGDACGVQVVNGMSFFSIKSIYINIEKIPITPSLCNNALS